MTINEDVNHQYFNPSADKGGTPLKEVGECNYFGSYVADQSNKDSITMPAINCITSIRYSGFKVTLYIVTMETR